MRLAPSSISTPMLIISTPWLKIGFSFCPTTLACVLSSPSIRGKFGPYISASKIPTLLPSFAVLMAKFSVVVLLPTPPLPLLIITKCLICGAIFLPLRELLFSSAILGCLIKISASAPSAFCAADLSSAAISGLALGISIPTKILSPISTSFTNPKSTMLLEKPG